MATAAAALLVRDGLEVLHTEADQPAATPLIAGLLADFTARTGTTGKGRSASITRAVANIPGWSRWSLLSTVASMICARLWRRTAGPR